MRIVTITYVINGTDYDTVDVDILLEDFELVPKNEGYHIDDIQESIE